MVAHRVIKGTLLGGLLVIGLTGGVPHAAHADATNPNASCLGVGASGAVPGTKDDISQFINSLAQATGTTHGAVIQPFVHQKGACIVVPPVPPHP